MRAAEGGSILFKNNAVSRFGYLKIEMDYGTMIPAI